MKLTKNFTRQEFLESVFYDEKQQEDVYISFKFDPFISDNIQELANNLQVLRDYLKTPISINIAFRPKWYEISKGRSGKSQHTKGKAADIIAKGYTPRELKKIIEKLISEGKMKEGGIGLYNTFLHYDIRGIKARWNNETN